MKKTYLLLILLFTLTNISLFAQDDLENMLDQDTKSTTDYTTATFKTTRIINTQSTELVPQGNLEFRISHRFGLVTGGVKEMFGLYSATTRLGFEYSPYKLFMIGLGLNSNKKTFDGFFKMHLIKQSKGKRNFPFTIALLASIAYSNMDWNYSDKKDYFSNRLSYCYQLIIARKFTEKISFQISPTLIHRNLVLTALDLNNMPAIGFAGRYKITKRVAINAEYVWRILSKRKSTTDNLNCDLFAIGFDFDTGGHIFQIHFTNASSLIETGFIPETSDKWWKGQIKLGFNINRQFKIHK